MTQRKSAALLGTFFLIAFVTAIAGLVMSGLISSSFSAPDALLKNIAEHKVRVRLSILVDLIASASVIGLGTLLYSVLKDHGPKLALIALGFFFMEATLLAVSRIGVFSLLQLSQMSVEAQTANPHELQVLGMLFRGFSNSGWLVLSFFFKLGGLIFYSLLYKSKIIPRFIAIFGIFAMVSGLTGFTLKLFGYDAGYFSYPNVIFEPFIGIWLLVRGFNSAAPEASPTERTTWQTQS
jgi:Domain of unknown function (DUF4386)